MRVLHVCECLPGGPSSYLRELFPYQTKELGDGAVGLVAPQGQVALLGSAAEGVRMFTYHQPRRGIRSYLKLFFAIRRSVRTFRPDIVHLHSTIAGLVGRLALLDQRGDIRTVYCAHGWMIDPDRPLRLKSAVVAVERALSSVTDRIVNLSPHETRYLLGYGFDPARMRLIVSGIADKDVSGPRSVSVSDRLNLLFIGRLDQQKGFDLLLSAIREVSPDKAVLTVVGEAIRNDRGSTDDLPNVRYTGWLSREEAGEQMSAADLIIMPSRWEGLPLVALEAMRAGKPLLASNKGAFPFLIQDGVTGLLVDTENSGFLARTLEQRSRAEFYAMGVQARRRYETEFMAAKMNRDTISLYQELATRRVERAMVGGTSAC